jgi:hypothetical protein
MMTFEQAINEGGWTMFHECGACKGGRRRFYNNPAFPGYEIRYRTSQTTFSIMLNNQKIAGPFYGYMLKDKLKEHVK